MFDKIDLCAMNLKSLNSVNAKNKIGYFCNSGRSLFCFYFFMRYKNTIHPLSILDLVESVRLFKFKK